LSLDWIYGSDVIEELKVRHPEWNFEVADGSRDEKHFFDGIDVYLRPSRCDGWSILCKEAEQCNIYVLWSFTGGYKEPNVDNIEAELVKISNKKGIKK